MSATTNPCKYSGLGIVSRVPDGPFLGKCECGAVVVIERGQFPWHLPGVGVKFDEWLSEHDAERARVMATRIRELHHSFGPSNFEENDYNSGAHEAIGQVLDIFRAGLVAVSDV